MSSWSNFSPELIGPVAPNCLKIFQVYLSKIDEVNVDMFKRVKAQGFTALALTCDTQQLGKREADVRFGFDLPQHLNLAAWAKYQDRDNTLATVLTANK